ncbi:hypothetical protein FA10DRAFT_300524 [Acaromyces ingoldii]|uniref:DUF952-domain-containing protein n=1 Tax=Acaromyces ingoldii TaxID=215250 RepID=A0A316YTI9_9BASI|nr:hypothetical protein FA10DRAFT_300524 [Acaromyces ingoldii]PWN91968.1 hypothetical protein FA10DRAFT_300524 [Acaromyces ingoldii]
MSDQEQCTVLYKILTPAERQSLPDGQWKGSELDLKDGFIHLSTSTQIPETLKLFFSAESGAGNELYIAALPRKFIDESVLRFEPAGSGCGHIYGTVDAGKDFVDIRKITRSGPQGTFELGNLTF